MNKIVVLLLFVLPANLAFARTPSSEERKSKKVGVYFRGPTFMFLDDYLGGTAGAEINYFYRPDTLLQVSFDYGALGNAGTYAGSGNVGHLLLGAKHFVSNSIFFTSAFGLRRAQVGDIRSELERDDIEGDYYDHEVVADFKTVTLGLNFALGWQWQWQKFSIGFEAANLFVPVVPLYAKGKPAPDYDGDADARAKQISQRADFTLTRLLIGLAF